MVKHYYPSGSFSFTVMTHNGDATGWSKISPFMNKAAHTYDEALQNGIDWYVKHLAGIEEEPEKELK